MTYIHTIVTILPGCVFDRGCLVSNSAVLIQNSQNEKNRGFFPNFSLFRGENHPELKKC